MMWVVTGVRGGVMSGIVFSVLNGRSCIIFVLFLCWWKCTCRKKKVDDEEERR